MLQPSAQEGCAQPDGPPPSGVEGRLKLHFLPPTSQWCVESGFLNSWEQLMAAAPAETARYRLVGQPSAADVCIVPWGEQFASGLGAVLRPLTRRDVETIVWDTGDRPTGRQSGFYCSLGRGLFDPARHCSISYPVTFNEFVELSPADAASLDFGFVGSMTAGVRKRLMARFGPVAQSLRATMVDADHVVPWQAFAHAATPPKRAYADFIRNTKFVLCPRGQGVSSIRLFEVLKSGRVPVIISDAFVPPHLQGPTRWADAALFVREREIEQIPALVAASLARWETMAACARRLWEENFADATVIDFVAANLARMATTRSAAMRSDFGGAALRHAAGVAGALAADQLRPALGAARQALPRRRREPSDRAQPRQPPGAEPA